VFRNDLQTQGNAVTAFLRRLAIQFSKTEHNPSTRSSAFEPSPDRRGVAKTTVLRQGRPANYQRRPASSRGKIRATSPRTSARHERATSTPARLARQVRSGCCFLHRFGPRGAASNPSETASSRRSTRNFEPFFLAPPRRGRVFYRGPPALSSAFESIGRRPEA
jgi:hypothetical protein